MNDDEAILYDIDETTNLIGKSVPLHRLGREIFSYFYDNDNTVNIPASRGINSNASAKEYGDADRLRRVIKELQNYGKLKDLLDITNFSTFASVKAVSAIEGVRSGADAKSDYDIRAEIKEKCDAIIANVKFADEVTEALTGESVRSLCGANWEVAKSVSSLVASVKSVRDINVERLIKLMGRMRELATTRIKNKTIYGQGQIDSITLGNDLESVLPDELALLFCEDTEDDFLVRYAEESLMQYQLKDRTDSTGGDIIILGDESGSMKAEINGSCARELMYATIQGIMEISFHQKRNVHYIGFCDKVRQPITFYHDGDKLQNASSFVQLMCQFTAGGTIFSTAINAANRLLSKLPYSDVVIVTDGAYSPSDLPLIQTEVAKMNAAKARLNGILIDLDDADYHKVKTAIGFSSTARIDMKGGIVSQTTGIGDVIYNSLLEKR